ncbi:thioredoxin family protein [Candidatus Protochlamydia amoebophila]|uniref:Thioredoxin n=1 Tax=Candidatus Protochlamydia amoebophila TaxID=362787 RepID=A0A0C1JY00_9BACT|nr:thioredoxin family protein [Candidatus Protochlamydia amoebophila]KIC72072.1 Thioredoxin [Candidatus Protochlamydia amoebophila]
MKVLNYLLCLFVCLTASVYSEIKSVKDKICCDLNASSIVEVTQDNFKQLIFPEKPVILMIYAEWCGCCCRFQPILETFSERFKESIRFAKLNYDEETDLADSFDINYFPTFIFIDSGIVMDKTDEIDTQEELESQIFAWINQLN